MTDDTDEHLTPSDPRPDGEPYYIQTTCETCDTDLVLYDEIGDATKQDAPGLADPETLPDDTPTWHDEWVCPECLDGVYLDNPLLMEMLERRVEDDQEWVTVDEAVENLGFDDGK